MRAVVSRLLIVVVACASLSSCAKKSDLPQLYVLPAVELIAENGQKTPLSSLNGRVAVYDFIFTRCPGMCPLLTRQMQKLTRKFSATDEVSFVSLSVDPSHDSPQVLSTYAEANRNDPRWRFFTGEHDAVRTLSVKGFKLAAMDGGSRTEPIVHSNKFVLVDRSGTIRAYYDGLDDASLDQLVRDAHQLIEE